MGGCEVEMPAPVTELMADRLLPTTISAGTPEPMLKKEDEVRRVGGVT